MLGGLVVEMGYHDKDVFCRSVSVSRVLGSGNDKGMSNTVICHQADIGKYLLG